MNSVPTNTTQLISSLREHIGAFLFVFFLVFTLSNIFLTAFGAIPKPAADIVEETLIDEDEEFTSEVDEGEELLAETEDKDVTTDTETVSSSALPVSITFESLGRTLPVNNPSSRQVADLDAALLTGVVRHPDSATLTQEGTVFILGHSSYLPVVNNRMYQAFNGIQNLKWGDTIKVTSEDAVYTYQVEKVYKAMAKDVSVPIAGTGNRLVIATCNSFGTVDGRYIVEAVLLGSEPLAVS